VESPWTKAVLRQQRQDDGRRHHDGSSFSLGKPLRRLVRLFLALEVMEEGTFGHASRAANVINRGGRVAVGANDGLSGQGEVARPLVAVPSNAPVQQDAFPIHREYGPKLSGSDAILPFL
jgi:hypothetical protein